MYGYTQRQKRTYRNVVCSQSPLGKMAKTMRLQEIYQNKKVFITGHTGFKGTWLGLWLQKLGAKVYGYSLAPYSIPNHFSLIQDKNDIRSYIADINDLQTLQNVLLEVDPDIIFHLAAQPLVRESYLDPQTTFQTNIIGVFNLFQSARSLKNLKAIINVTTDKVYENKEQIWAYRENDALGGYDPYSASKACSEIVTDSMRKSFFNPSDFGKTHQVLIATARSGNVIGGGDWSKDRLIVDLVLSANSKQSALIRSPKATRPWQHVLEPIYGYLLLGKKLLQREISYASSFNFGPKSEDNLEVGKIVEIAKTQWSEINYTIQENDSSNPHEAELLMLDPTKAQKLLQWHTIWNAQEAIEKTIDWYRKFYTHNKIITIKQLDEYIMQIKEKK